MEGRPLPSSLGRGRRDGKEGWAELMCPPWKMPYVWVKPKVALAHRGVKVYHVYKNDNVDEGVREYRYG